MYKFSLVEYKKKEAKKAKDKKKGIKSVPQKKKVTKITKPVKKFKSVSFGTATIDNHLWESTKQRSPSEMEIKISFFLKSLKIKFKAEYNHSTLFNPRTGARLFIDFYLPDKNVVIEYDGKQHYFNNDHKLLKEQQYKDWVKNTWCKKNNIRLLRISYLQQSNYEKIITNFLN